MNWIPKYETGTIIRKRKLTNHENPLYFKIVGYNIEHQVYIIDELESVLGSNAVLRIYGPTFDMNKHEYEVFFEK